jgi:hypothetical protein
LSTVSVSDDRSWLNAVGSTEENEFHAITPPPLTRFPPLVYSLPFNEAPFLTAAKAEVEAIRIAVATAISFLGVVFIWVLGVWGIIVLVWSKKISLGLTADEY